MTDPQSSSSSEDKDSNAESQLPLLDTGAPAASSSQEASDPDMSDSIVDPAQISDLDEDGAYENDELEDSKDYSVPAPDDSSPSTESADDQSLASLLREMELVTKEEINGIMEWREHTMQQGRTPKPLGDLLLDNNLITPNQLRRCREKLERSTPKQQIPGYQIIERLGAGAMATVFKARQMSLDRTVAVKVLPKRFTSDPEFVQRFYEEGRAAGKLNHPNIVQAFDVGRAGEYHYFVMELVEGHTVHDHMEKHSRYREKEALDVVIMIARALKHAHDKGFIHRDVKPKNIMITRGGVAKLADMGLAREVADREAAEAEAGRAFGTPYYISPEQIRGSVDVDFRCDIYGLGATFYHMITGRVPFDGENPSNVMHRHLKDPLVPPDHIVSDLSAGVSEIIEVMMAKDPTDRYETTADLLEDLEAVARSEPPLQARSHFSMASLSTLEQNATLESESAEEVSTRKGRGKKGKNGKKAETWLDKQHLLKHPIIPLLALIEALVIVALVIMLLIEQMS